MEFLGFTVEGQSSDIENDGDFFDDEGKRRPSASAFMTREDFLARYGKVAPEKM